MLPNRGTRKAVTSTLPARRSATAEVDLVFVLRGFVSNIATALCEAVHVAAALAGLSEKSGRHAMARIDRRRVLQLSGAGAVAAATGGIAGILASGRAPAFAQGTTLHWVRGSDYVPASDQMVRTKLNELAQKELGLKINLEGVDGLTIQARVASAVSSGSGPDIICALNNWAQLYTDSVVDVSDVAEEIGKAHGGYYETSKAIA